MVILGLDPGIATVGFGVISAEKGFFEALRYGVIRTEAGLPLSERLEDIYGDMERLMDVFAPEAVAVEELFFNTNHKTGIAVAHGRGVLLLACRKRGVEVYEYTPLQVKQSVAGYGRADKRQVAEMVRRLLKLEEVPGPDDAADALAIALCHGRAATSLLFGQGGGLKTGSPTI
jgi:crossover junction endodeoxyribonuclease RuvC